uniref:Putative secreted protein n=1 Tax=Amblyomma cajennense TaxID=34607 RepID=A0A023FD16_AMBCJ
MPKAITCMFHIFLILQQRCDAACCFCCVKQTKKKSRMLHATRTMRFKQLHETVVGTMQLFHVHAGRTLDVIHLI